jgi:hypothetical protein
LFLFSNNFGYFLSSLFFWCIRHLLFCCVEIWRKKILIVSCNGVSMNFFLKNENC